MIAWCRPATTSDRQHVRWYSFDWTRLGANVEVYSIMLPGGRSIEGMIALESRPGWMEVRLMAVAPSNLGRDGRYQVGGALFAIACRRSLEEGSEGFIAFNAKTVLASYYAKQYGARAISSRGAPRMVIEGQPAEALVTRYIRP